MGRCCPSLPEASGRLYSVFSAARGCGMGLGLRARGLGFKLGVRIQARR